MKFGKPERLTILIILILSVIYLFQSINNFKHPKRTPEKDYVPYKETKKIPENAVEISKKYGLFEDIFLSETPVLIYQYDPISVSKNNSAAFHKKLTKRIKEENLNFKQVAYTDWNAVYEKISESCDKKNPKSGSCSPNSANPEDIEILADLIDDCVASACITDTKSQTYTIIDKDTDYIIRFMKTYKTSDKE